MTDYATEQTTNEIPYGYCHCGCGQKTKIVTQSNTKEGRVKGEPNRFIIGHNALVSLLPWYSTGTFAPWVEKFGLNAPYGKCQCGCGEDSPISPQTTTIKGYLKGHPMRFVPLHGNSSPIEKQFWAKVDRRSPDECWEWTDHKLGGRYGRMRSHGQTEGAHRISYKLHYGKIPDGMHVCHTCDNPGCVNPAHLFLGTPKENLDDMREKGREYYPKGEDSASARLSENQVKSIRERFQRGEIQRILASEYGVSQSTISEIVLKKIWKHIP